MCGSARVNRFGRLIAVAAMRAQYHRPASVSTNDGVSLSWKKRASWVRGLADAAIGFDRMVLYSSLALRALIGRGARLEVGVQGEGDGEGGVAELADRFAS